MESLGNSGLHWMKPVLGGVTAVRGSVFEVRFEQQLPPIRTLLSAGTTDGDLHLPRICP